MALFKIIKTITMMIITTIMITKIIIIIMISTTIFQNIAEKLDIFGHILFSQFLGFYRSLRCYMPHTGRKGVIKLQQIISKTCNFGRDCAIQIVMWLLRV